MDRRSQEYSIEAYLERLSSKDPVPGGGGASGVAAALGCSLAEMVCQLTTGKKKYAEFRDELEEAIQALSGHRARFLALADQDAEVFAGLARCYALPKATEEEKAVKERAMEAALGEAVLPPSSVLAECLEVLRLTGRIAQIGSILVLSDAGAAAGLLCGAAESAVFSVLANTRMMKDRTKAAMIDRQTDSLLKACRQQAEGIRAEVEKRLM